MRVNTHVCPGLGPPGACISPKSRPRLTAAQAAGQQALAVKSGVELLLGFVDLKTESKRN